MKFRDIKLLPDEELVKKESEARMDLMKLNAQVATGTTPKSPGQVARLRRTLAKIATVRQQRQGGVRTRHG